MGGRWMITAVQVTYILKGEVGGEAVEEFVKELSTILSPPHEILDVLLDDSTINDVEV
ncbi:hypothetical protein ES703_116931 [subsurface metagenome]